MNTIIIGIDISKQKFDVAINLSPNKFKSLSLDNKLSGFEKLLKHLPEADNYRFIMEATGNYGLALAKFLYAQGYEVVVLNPAQIKYYAKSKLSRSKTDQVDARIIAEFGITHSNLTLWQPLVKEMEELRELSRCFLNLKDDAATMKIRIQATDNSQVNDIYHRQLLSLQQQINLLENSLTQIINSHSELKQNFELLQTIPGIGVNTAITLLAELPDLRNFKHPKQLAAFAGLNPSIKLSGSSLYKRQSISKMGSPQLRKALFFPAMVACRFNPILKSFAQHLKSKGKNGKVIIIAVMRKLLHLIFAIIKKSSPFNPNYTLNYHLPLDS